MSRLRAPAFPLLFGFAAAGLIALLPWWRNRGYLRDMYDYGLVLAANGRMELGEKPYVDFTTPIQAGFLRINYFFEKIGGDYASLTLGGAALIVAATWGLVALLARRWTAWPALVMGTTIAVMSASQHTILWHNALGVFCLALVTWGAACAPVWRRETWGWHAVLVAGLLLGGVNKLNFHLVGVAVALAWALRAGMVRTGSWGRVAASVAGILFFGAVGPVMAELFWTGATFAQWYGNVVQLAAGSRSELLWQIWSVDFLLKPLHNYYGPLWVSQAGLVGAGLTVVTLIAGWRDAASPAEQRRGRVALDQACRLLAGGLAGGAGAALLITNFEISYLGIGAWLVLLVSVWLGFSGCTRSRFFRFGFVLPAAVCAVAAWWSAWLGQRSQFGFSTAPRESYRAADTLGPAFANLRGLRLPPEVMESLSILPTLLPDEDADGVHPLFYGKGLEFFHRYYPAVNWKGMPLWCHFGTSYGPREIARLNEALRHDESYSTVFVTQAYDHWPQPIRDTLQQYFAADFVGPVVRRWERRSEAPVDFSDSIQSVMRLGGNVDGRVFQKDRYRLRTLFTTDKRVLLGTTQRVGQVVVRAPTYRLRGVLVVDRLQAPADVAISATCKLIVHGLSPEEVRWSKTVELAAGEQAITIPFEADLGGQPAQLWINRGDRTRGVAVGFRDFEITHAVESPGGAPVLNDRILAESPDSAALGQSLFGAIAWRPQVLVVRGGRPEDAGLGLPVGGEAWFHTDYMTGEIRGKLSVAETEAGAALVRVVWYKGGRLQILQHCRVSAGAPADFYANTAEPGGWIGFLVESTESVAPVVLRITQSSLAP